MESCLTQDTCAQVRRPTTNRLAYDRHVIIALKTRVTDNFARRRIAHDLLEKIETKENTPRKPSLVRQGFLAEKPRIDRTLINEETQLLKPAHPPLHQADDRWISVRLQKKKKLNPSIHEISESAGFVLKKVNKARSILNKITESTFAKLTHKLWGLLGNDENTIGVIFDVLFRKALDEDLYCPLYARVVCLMSVPLRLLGSQITKFAVESFNRMFQSGMQNIQKIKFLKSSMNSESDDHKRLELQIEINTLSAICKCRSLGSMKLIGEFYKLDMLNHRVMVECVNTMLCNKDEHSYECLCKLLCTIGRKLEAWMNEPVDGPGWCPFPNYLETLFAQLKLLTEDLRLSERIRFAILDVCEMRDNYWVSRRDLKRMEQEAMEEETDRNAYIGLEKSKSNIVEPSWRYGNVLHVPSRSHSSNSNKSDDVQPNLMHVTIPRIEISPALSSPSSPSGNSQKSEGGLKSPCVDRHEYLKRKVGAIFEDFSKAKRWEWSLLNLIQATFPGDKINVFVDSLSRQFICDIHCVDNQKTAAFLVRTLIERGLITSTKVIDVLRTGVIKDLGEFLLVPHGTVDLAGFLAEIFFNEPDLRWLITLTENLPSNSDVWTDLFWKVSETIKSRFPKSKVQRQTVFKKKH